MLEIVGTLFIIILGTTFHYLYDWSNHNKIVGYFTAVNESTWEHLKLIFAPVFLWMIVEFHFYKNIEIYFFARFVSLLVMLIIIPLIFYSYMFFNKKNSFVVNILSFIISPIIGQIIFKIILDFNFKTLILKHIGIIGLVVLFLMYLTKTYVPTKSFLYKDPITNKYGVEGHYKK